MKIIITCTVKADTKEFDQYRDFLIEDSGALCEAIAREYNIYPNEVMLIPHIISRLDCRMTVNVPKGIFMQFEILDSVSIHMDADQLADRVLQKTSIAGVPVTFYIAKNEQHDRVVLARRTT